MSDISPSDAVSLEEATDDTVADAVDDHAAAEGAATESPSSLGSQSSLQEMLLSTDPAPSLDAVESPWDPDRGGPTRIMRAFQKMTGVDGLPAGADLVLGALETLDSMGPDDGDDDDQDDDVDVPLTGGDPAR